jgi:hypothetical protein
MGWGTSLRHPMQHPKMHLHLPLRLGIVCHHYQHSPV